MSKSRYLTGDTITEADVRLFTTLVRFDMVYVGHFKVLKNFVKVILDIKGINSHDMHVCDFPSCCSPFTYILELLEYVFIIMLV